MPAGKTPAAAAAPTADAPTSCTAGDLLCLQRLALRCFDRIWHMHVAEESNQFMTCFAVGLLQSSCAAEALHVGSAFLCCCSAAATGKCAAAGKAADDAMAAINSGVFTPTNGGGAYQLTHCDPTAKVASRSGGLPEFTHSLQVQTDLLFPEWLSSLECGRCVPKRLEY